MVRHDEPHAVGPDQPHAAAPRDLHQRGLPGGALGPGLGEARGDDHAAADAGRRRLGHARHQRATGHRQDGDVRRGRRRRDRGIRAAPQHLGPTRVDRIDLAGEPVLDQEAHDAAAELVLAIGGAEDGDGARMQDPIELEARAGAIDDGGGVEGLGHVWRSGLYHPHAARRQTVCNVEDAGGVSP